jgi:hypothetical protein
VDTLRARVNSPSTITTSALYKAAHSAKGAAIDRSDCLVWPGWGDSIRTLL